MEEGEGAMLSRGHNSSGACHPTLPLSKSRNTVGLTFRPGEEPLLHYAASASRFVAEK